MSTSEKWSSDYSRCPCGHGRIIEHVDSPDNGWSRTTYSYSIECERCRMEWSVDGKELHDRAAGDASSKANSQKFSAEEKLKAIGSEMIDQIVESGDLQDYQAEYRMLQQAEVCKEGPIRYRKARKRGVRASSLCDVLWNIPWIIARISDLELKRQAEALMKLRDDSDAALNTAKRRLKSISIASLKADKGE